MLNIFVYLNPMLLDILFVCSPITKFNFVSPTEKLLKNAGERKKTM